MKFFGCNFTLCFQKLISGYDISAPKPILKYMIDHHIMLKHFNTIARIIFFPTDEEYLNSLLKYPVGEMSRRASKLLAGDV